MNVIITSIHGVCIHAFVWRCLSVNKSWFCSSLPYWTERWVSSRIIHPSLHLHVIFKNNFNRKKKNHLYVSLNFSCGNNFILQLFLHPLVLHTSAAHLFSPSAQYLEKGITTCLLLKYTHADATCIVNISRYLHAVIVPPAVRLNDKPNQNVQAEREKGKEKQASDARNRNKGLDWFFPLRMKTH